MRFPSAVYSPAGQLNVHYNQSRVGSLRRLGLHSRPRVFISSKETFEIRARIALFCGHVLVAVLGNQSLGAG